MDDIVREFLAESHEGLDRLDRDLVRLEADPDDRELLAGIFRAVHTIKGTCGFLGFSRLEALSHHGENLLARMRDGSIRLDADVATALLALVDALRQALERIERTGGEGDEADAGVTAALKRLLDGGGAASRPPAMREAPEPSTPELERVERPVGQILVEAGAAAPEDVAAAIADQAGGNPERLGDILVARGQASRAAVQLALAAQGESRREAADGRVRVEVDVLDRLSSLAGELARVREELSAAAPPATQPAFVRAFQRLGEVSQALQEAITRTRLQPVAAAWSRLPRLARDLSRTLHKQVVVEMEGGELELDRTIVEAIRDPLTHIVRNAADHGIEPAAIRLARGKPATGRVLLRARREGGQAVIEVSDDGAGVDAERVRRKAIERGLVTPERAARMAAREYQILLFAPGFTTVDQVSSTSGRGVGLDVVRTSVERIGGSASITSVVGEGTTVRLRIPEVGPWHRAAEASTGLGRSPGSPAAFLEAVASRDS